MPVEYINSAGSNSTIVNACDATSGWSSLGGTAGVATSSYVEREGTDCLEWGGDTGGPRGAYFDIGAGNEFSIDSDDFSCWFLPAERFSGTTYLTLDGTDPDAVLIRLSSAAGFTTNYGEFHRALSGVNLLIPSWNPLICSGNTADAVSGTFTRTSIRSFGVVTNQVGDNNTSFFTSTPDHGMDAYRLGKNIRVTGTDGGQPWTFEKVFNALEGQKPFHGLIEKVGNLYLIKAGIIIGDGTTVTTFEDDNAFVFIQQTSSQVRHDFRVKANATVTLGKKTTGSVRNFASDGVRITTNPIADHSSEFIVEDGATCNFYDLKIENWNLVELGDGAGTDPTLELIKIDFVNNGGVDFRSTGLSMDDIRLHSWEGQERDMARILATPTLARNVRGFQNLEALRHEVDVGIDELFAGDNTTDITVKNLTTTTLTDARLFDVNKIDYLA